MKSTAVNLGLLLVSHVAGLTLCEVSLRLFYPKYRHVAEGQFQTDTMRLQAHTPNSRKWINHPDTLVPHSLYHNNLALRQHRDFSEADLVAATNIGFFGDSFTENFLMPVQYSFTEPLDYLLNQGRRRFNVLNFGVNSTGPGQSFLHYQHFRYAKDLAHVFYVYYENDLRDILIKGLFHLDEAGHLVRNEAIRESWWTPLIRRLHIAYLVLDVRHRWSSLTAETTGTTEYLKRGIKERVRDERSRAWRRARSALLGKPGHGDRQSSVAIFRQLIRSWKHLAEENGSTFSVVLIPNRPAPAVVDLLNAEDVEIIDLNDCFRDHDPAHHDRAWADSPYRFRKDGHWNEAGNQLTAICLYRFLEEKIGLQSLSEERLWEAISRYYAAFEGGMPLKAGGRGARGIEISGETAATIQEKYLALDMKDALKDVQDEFIKLVTQPDKPIIDSVFDVYLDRNHLFYVKADCRPADMEARFFLHMIPVDEKHLHELRRSQGFNRYLFKFPKRTSGIGRHGCVTMKPLPYPVRYIRTGQYVWDEGRLWEGEGWIGSHNVGEDRPEFPAAAGKRIIRSDFDVYLDDRHLVYHKADCGPADRETPFFLHVTPTDETDLPSDRVQHGFENLDFDTCMVERSLPAYAIRHIRTGQFVRNEGHENRLWEVEFSLDPARISRGDERAAASRQIVRSVFDVTLDGRRLIYRKAACRAADRRARFFLHVTPVDVADLPPSRLFWGFDNLDFPHRLKFSVNELGCTRTQMLPAYAIRHIRTGQYIPGKGPLWEGQFAIAQDALEQD